MIKNLLSSWGLKTSLLEFTDCYLKMAFRLWPDCWHWLCLVIWMWSLDFLQFSGCLLRLTEELFWWLSESLSLIFGRLGCLKVLGFWEALLKIKKKLNFFRFFELKISTRNQKEVIRYCKIKPENYGNFSCFSEERKMKHKAQLQNKFFKM